MSLTQVHDNVAAWILHERAYRETSSILEVFTHDYGKIAIVARGSHRTRRGGQPLSLFRPLWLKFQLRGELGNLRAAEALGPALSLSGMEFLAACYINELVMKLLPRFDPVPEVFLLYQRTLLDIEKKSPAATALFEGRFISELGLAPSLLHDSAGQPLDHDVCYSYDPQHGLLQNPRGLTGGRLAEIAAEQYSDPQVLSDARRFYHRIIRAHLGHQRLKSVEVANEVLNQ